MSINHNQQNEKTLVPIHTHKYVDFVSLGANVSNFNSHIYYKYFNLNIFYPTYTCCYYFVDHKISFSNYAQMV